MLDTIEHDRSAPPPPSGVCGSAKEQAHDRIPDGQLREFLKAATDYVVLRNHDIGVHLAQGGDVDLLVLEQRNTEQLLFAHLGPPLCKAARSYVWNYFYHWGHIDLLPSLEWHGAVYLPAKTVLRDARKSHLGWGKPRLAHEALVSWFSSLLWGGLVRDRYRDVIVDAARDDGSAFRQALIHAVGCVWGERLRQIAAEGRPETAANWVSPLRRAVFCRALRREPLGTLRGWVAFWLAEICLRLRPTVPWVAILGPDGSGKTTVLEAIRARSPRAFVGVNVFHWRPGVTRPSRGSGPVTNPHAHRPRGFFISIAKLADLLLDWIVGYWTRLVHLRAKGYLVVFDRHYLDIVVDPVRYRYGGPAWLARLVGRLVPKPNLVILLDAPVELLRGRKQEVPAEETARQRKAYLDLVLGLRNGHVVDASKPAPEVVSQVEEIIFDWMARRAPRFEGVKVAAG